MTGIIRKAVYEIVKFKRILLAAALTFAALFSFNAHALDEVSVFVNGIPLGADGNAYIENGCTMVPARSIFERLGATVSWNQENRTVTAERDNTNVKLIIGSRALNVNGTLTNMDTEPVINDGSTYVPVRAVSRAFGANVAWIPELRAVSITTDGIKTLSGYPDVLVPDFASFDAVCISEKADSISYILTVPEAPGSEVADDIIKLVLSYEESMTGIGWTKRICENSCALFETDFIGKDKYEVKYCISKAENGKYSFGMLVTDYITVYNTVTGEVNVVTESEYLLTAAYRDTTAWKKSVGKNVTLYDNNNNTVSVPDYDAYRYLLAGYTEKEKTVTMYSPEGGSVQVGVHLVADYEALGYRTNDMLLMYSPDGRAEYVDGDLLEQYITEGWSTEPFKITVYNHNGDSIMINLHEKDARLADGWYEELLIPMYRPDGTKIYVEKRDVPFYEVFGWLTAPPQNAEIYEERIITDYTTVYITPTGKKYHISQKCAGSGAIPKVYREVEGLYEPCKTCTASK